MSRTYTYKSADGKEVNITMTQDEMVPPASLKLFDTDEDDYTRYHITGDDE